MATLSWTPVLTVPVTRYSGLLAPAKSSRSVCVSSFVGQKLQISSRVPAQLPRAAGLFTMGSKPSAQMAQQSIHEFSVTNIDGKEVSLSEYKGKVALVVNVASACGLTASNYAQLTELYNKYKDQGFTVLAFPSNQFGGQEPGTSTEIKEFACSRYKAEFPLFGKIDVNGPKASPVFQWLKTQEKGGEFLGSDIKWNFGKFLINKEGKVVNRYAPTTSPSSIEKDIKALL